jgi:hypothetical protein
VLRSPGDIEIGSRRSGKELRLVGFTYGFGKRSEQAGAKGLG